MIYLVQVKNSNLERDIMTNPSTKNVFAKFDKHIAEINALLNTFDIPSHSIEIETFSDMARMKKEKMNISAFYKAVDYDLFKRTLGGWQIAKIDTMLFLVKSNPTNVIYVEVELKK